MSDYKSVYRVRIYKSEEHKRIDKSSLLFYCLPPSASRESSVRTGKVSKSNQRPVFRSRDPSRPIRGLYWRRDAAHLLPLLPHHLLPLRLVQHAGPLRLQAQVSHGQDAALQVLISVSLPIRNQVEILRHSKLQHCFLKLPKKAP